jgi:hypothetical protein
MGKSFVKRPVRKPRKRHEENTQILGSWAVRIQDRRKYEEESVNRPQMYVKHMIVETGKEHLFLDISSTNIDTLVPSLYQCVEISSI